MQEAYATQLPPALQEGIDALTRSLPLAALAQASEELSHMYRCEQPRLTNPMHRLAYLTTRLPATYQAVLRVLYELVERTDRLAPRTLLDLGAGPGTASWAATQCFPSLQQLTLLECERACVEMGQSLAEYASAPAWGAARWVAEDLLAPQPWPKSDLVLFSYSLGEIPVPQLERVLRQAWESTEQALAVIEPGTPKGYGTVLAARRCLIDWGGKLIAPCPHADRCPMERTSDWCHFACRVQRSSVHRQAKSAQLGYEDEKYSYVLFTRDERGQRAEERVLRHPQIKPGHVNLFLCTPSGLQKSTVSKKQGEAYRLARKVKWGDGWG